MTNDFLKNLNVAKQQVPDLVKRLQSMSNNELSQVIDQELPNCPPEMQQYFKANKDRFMTAIAELRKKHNF